MYPLGLELCRYGSGHQPAELFRVLLGSGPQSPTSMWVGHGVLSSAPPSEAPLETASCSAGPVIKDIPYVNCCGMQAWYSQKKKTLDQGADRVDWRTDKKPECTTVDE